MSVADPLASLALRVQMDPYFLAAAMETYRRSEGLDPPGLAARLGCPEEQLAALALCRCPRSSSPAFWDEMCHIVERFDVDAVTLAEAVRRFEALAAWREEEMEAGWLQAARDRLPPAGGSVD